MFQLWGCPIHLQNMCWYTAGYDNLKSGYIYIYMYVYIGARLQFHPRKSRSMRENTVFSHTKCLSRIIQSWMFFSIFFFGIKLPNRVPLNHPINEAATKTLTFSVILFELPSEHCACGHGFIGFAEPMSPLRFMHTHSYLRPPTIQRLCAGQCPLHWAGCSEEWTTIACSMTDVVTGDTRKIFLIGTGPITVLQGTRSYFLLSQGLQLFLCLRRRRDTTIALAFGATFWHAPHTVKETIKMILSDIADMSHVWRKKPGPKGPAMMIKTSMSFCRWQGASKCMTCRSSKVSVPNTMSSADFRWWKADMIMPTWTRGVVWRSGTYIYIVWNFNHNIMAI